MKRRAIGWKDHPAEDDVFEIRVQEKFEFHIAALDPPAGENVRESFGADDAFAPEVFRVVLIEPACKQNFQK